MTKMQRKMMERFYREAQGDPAKLPWHTDELPSFLIRAIHERSGPTRALDVGCGSGIHAAQLAERGVEVTAIDCEPAAIAMAKSVAAERGAPVELIEVDLFEYTPEHPFEVVFDSGCLHNMAGSELTRYRERLLNWIAPQGDFILGHWGKRHALDWRPIGPRRRKTEALKGMFAPDLRLVESESTDERVAFPFGPWVRMSAYWFRRDSEQG